MSKGQLTILCYHGVTDAKSTGIENFTKKHLSVAVFREQMHLLKEQCCILSMDEVMQHLNDRLPFEENSVAVTFDDGFRNNYTHAAPILSDLDIPATFYITAGMIGNDQLFWVDEIEDLINFCSEEKLSLHLTDQAAFELTTAEKKIDATDRIRSYCKSISAAERKKLMEGLKRSCKNTASVQHAVNYQKMNWEELKALHDHELFTIGGHSMYHDILSSLPLAEMQNDISASIQLLEKRLGTDIIHYAYPEGGSGHYNDDVIEALKNNGIICCPSAIKGVNDHLADPFHLKRIMPGFKGEPFPITKRSVQFVPR